jgi:hypothetical protein
MQTAKPKRSAIFWAVTFTELAVVLWAVGLMTGVQPEGSAADDRLALASQVQGQPQAQIPSQTQNR